jgi:hypothetical protein
MLAPPWQKKAPGEQSPDARAPIERTLFRSPYMLRRLAAYCPAQFLRGMWVMDSVHIHVPRGAHTEVDRG